MSSNDVTAIALGAVGFVVVAEHAVLLAFWGLFWKRGWRIQTPTAQKQDATQAGPESPPSTVVVSVGRGPDGKFRRAGAA